MKLSLFILFSSLSMVVFADLPVECLRTQIHDQTWNFHVSQDKQVVNLYDTKEFCTHQQPNRMQIIQKGHQWKFDKEDIWQISIKADFSAEGNFCPDGNLKKCDKQQVRGSWFAIYDQVIVLKLENGIHFNANFKYEILPSVSKKAMNLIKNAGDDKKMFSSICDATMIGHVNNMTENSTIEEHRVECFYAQKDQKKLYENQIGSRAESDTADIQLIQTDQEQQTKATVKSWKPRKHNLMAEHVPSDETDLQIVEINKSNRGWTANTCMLQTSHPLYDHKECGESESEMVCLAQTFAQKDEETQTSRPKKKFKTRDQMSKSQESGQKPFDNQSQDFPEAVKKAHSFRNKYKNIEEIPEEVLPDTWDWRNIDGYDFTSAIYDQAACGSCYMAAMIQVIESRLKIKYAGEKNTPKLSAQHLLQCNYMNEGCGGGLFYFGGLFANRAGLVSEECAPYLAQTKSKTCASYKNCPVVAKVDKSYFLGEYSYKPTVAEIKKEIIRNGPVNTEIFCNEEWSMYKKGIYQQSQGEYQKRDSWGNRFASRAETEAPLLVPSSGDINYIQTGTENKDSDDTIQSTVQRENQKAKGAENTRSSQTGMATQELDHSVILVGWKMEPETNTQVWILRNSYGDSWGMNGDMYVRMGSDDFGVESEIGGFKVSLE